MTGERGFVFAAVTAVLVLAAAVLGGAFFYALQDQRLGRGTQDALRALAAAEAGAAAALAGWSREREGALLPGESLAAAPALGPGAGSAAVTVTAWGERLMLVRSRGSDPTGQAAREIGVLVRLALPRLDLPAAVVAVDSMAPGMAARIDSTDGVPPGWSCAEPPRDAPAVGTSPPDPWRDWDSLAALAVPGTGLPSAAQPAVLVRGDLDQFGGAGVGILLVEGDATFAGGATLTGLLLVRGALRFIGTGGRVVGAVRAGSIGADAAALGVPVTVKWSSCAVLRVRRAVAHPVVVSGWGWADFSGGW